MEFNKIEDFYEWVAGDPESRSQTRFTLQAERKTEYVDPEAGKQFWNKLHQIGKQLHEAERQYRKAETPYKTLFFGEAIEILHKQDTEVRDQEPEKVTVVSFWLEEGQRYYKKTYPIAAWMAVLLDEQWTHRPIYKGSRQEQRVGGLLVSTIIKRLGGDPSIIRELVVKQQAERKFQAQERALHHCMVKLDELDSACRDAGFTLEEYLEVYYERQNS